MRVDRHLGAPYASKVGFGSFPSLDRPLSARRDTQVPTEPLVFPNHTDVAYAGAQ